jgi:hypothetical protein
MSMDLGARRIELEDQVFGLSTKPMRKFDIVVCVGFDEDFRVEGFVESAGGASVVVAVTKVNALQKRFEPLLETERYRVVWAGSGYAVQRKVDSYTMTKPERSAALAERKLRDFESVRGR